MRGKWVIRDSILAILSDEGSLVDVSASETLGSEFKNKSEIKNLKVNKPSVDLPEIKFNRFPLNLRTKITISKYNDSEQSIDLSIEGFKKDLSYKFNDHIPEHLLLNSEWWSLSKDETLSIEKCLKDCDIQGVGSITLRQYFNLVANQDRFLKLEIKFDNQTHVNESNYFNKVFKCPAIFTAKLYPYQERGVLWLNGVSDDDIGCILADEMGLGKTIQVIAFLLTQLELRGMPCLIVSPATLMENWRREIRKFSNGVKLISHRGQYRSGFPSDLSSADIVLTSYETIVRDLSLFKMIDWDCLILDEAQSIKNPKAQRTISIKELKYRFGLAVTGTPFENRLTDVWSLFDFCCVGLLGNLDQFENKFNNNLESAEILETLISPLILRRRIKDVAKDLPDIIYIPQPINLSNDSAMKYEELRKEILEEYGKSGNLVALTKLRLYCTHPFILNKDDGKPENFSTKYERLIEILNEIVSLQDKVIIFTSYSKMIDILHVDLRSKYEIYCNYIDGRTNIESRQDIIDQFSKVNGSAILVLNPKAAGTGLNITAANHVIHYNLEWNPAVEDQATARSYRRGQDRPVRVYRLFHSDTVEEIINYRISEKRVLADASIKGNQARDIDIQDIIRSLEISPEK